MQANIPSVREVMNKNLPDKKFRSGAVSATIWTNTLQKDGKAVAYKTVSIERNYKDKQGNWKTTSSLRVADIPRAVLVLNKSYEYLALNDDGIDEEVVQ